MRAKDLLVKPISGKDAKRIIKALHYSGTVVNNSRLHLGVFAPDGKCGGAMSFGPPLDRSKVIGLVKGSTRHSMLELNRMAFADWLPRNSESRAMGVAFRMLRKKYPALDWILSFSDATQCGDGAIYRASGFDLTAIKKNANVARKPDGSTLHKLNLERFPARGNVELGGKSYFDFTGGKYAFRKVCDAMGWTILKGFQLRYIRFLTDDARSRYTADLMPFSAIDAAGARMYRGEKIFAPANNTRPDTIGEVGGAEPTLALQF